MTILLLVQPNQSFESIKQDLLTAVRATGRTEINDSPLPSDSNDVVFGLPIDKTDLSQGWVDLALPEKDEDDSRPGKVKKGSLLNTSPMGAGLKDGALLAFKFTGEGDDWDVVIPNYDEEEAMDRVHRSS